MPATAISSVDSLRGGRIWFHDRITTGGQCLPEINIGSVQDKLSLHQVYTSAERTE
jgi:hypothetical protein